MAIVVNAIQRESRIWLRADRGQELFEAAKVKLDAATAVVREVLIRWIRAALLGVLIRLVLERAPPTVFEVAVPLPEHSLKMAAGACVL